MASTICSRRVSKKGIQSLAGLKNGRRHRVWVCLGDVFNIFSYLAVGQNLRYLFKESWGMVTPDHFQRLELDVDRLEGRHLE